MTRAIATFCLLAVLFCTGCPHQTTSPTPSGPPLTAVSNPNPHDYRLNITCVNCSGHYASYAPDVATSLARINSIEESQCFKNFFKTQADAGKVKELEKRDSCDVGTPVTKLTIDEIYADISTAKIDLNMKVEPRLSGTNCGLEGKATSDLFTVRDSPKCWGGYDIQKRAGLLAHEASHKLNYKHCIDDTNSNTNVSNVPYLVQNAIEACWNEQAPVASPGPIQ